MRAKYSLAAALAASTCAVWGDGRPTPSYQPGMSYLVSCGAEDENGNFTCHRELVGATSRDTAAKAAAAQIATAKAPVAADAGKVAPSEASAKVPIAAASATEATRTADPIPAGTVAPGLAAVNAAKAKSADEAIADLAQADLSVPVSPAAALLGISADKVQRPGTIRELAASVIHGLGADGKPQNGVAFDIAPVFVFAPGLFHAGTDYAPDGAKGDLDGTFSQHVNRILARTTVSFGTASADSNGATRSALGLRVGLFDSGDPGLYWSKAVDCVNNVPPPALAPPPAAGDIGKPLPQIPVDLSACDPAIGLWAKPSLYVGYGQSWYSQSGSLSGQAPNVAQYWMSGSWGWAPKDRVSGANSFRVLGQLYMGRQVDDRTPDPNNTSQLLRQDTTDAIARLRAGKSNWHGFLELGRSRVKLGNNTSEDLRHAAVGVEFQLNWFGTDNWLELASISDRGYIDGKDHTGVMMNFRLGTPALSLSSSAKAAAPSN
jgi:hypothetical protein